MQRHRADQSELPAAVLQTMGDISEFSFPVRLFLKTYRWRRIDPAPWTALLKPLNQCRLALVTTAGLVPPGADAFDESARGGDFSFRVISAETDMSRLRDWHRSETFDHAGMRQDANLVFPLDRILELAQRGRIGSVNHRHLSFMGSITAPGRLMKETAPEAARLLAQDEVDVSMLVPV